MSKRNQQTPSRNGAIAIAHNPVSDRRKPVSFARQLLAPQPAATAPGPSRSARFSAWFLRSIQRLTKRLVKRRGTKLKLQLLELQQLGEKRFVAIVRVGKQKFLIGGAATSVSLLAEINAQNATALASRPLDQESA
jgi:hypothetical protein